jgi:hypothetical protein
MPDFLERAVSGRAKCRGCGRVIEKDDWRFGESLPNPYGEGDSVFWFHLTCGACMRPEKTRDALRSYAEPVPDRAWLEHAIELGIANERLVRLAGAERSPSGRARCRECHELVEKGAWRLSLQVFEEGRMSSIGYLHLGCAEAYFATADIVDRIRRLSPHLAEGDTAEIASALAGPARPALAKTQAEEPSGEAPTRTAG